MSGFAPDPATLRRPLQPPFDGSPRPCPYCRAQVTNDRFEHVTELPGLAAVSLTVRGSVWGHVRDVHPDRWAWLLRRQERANSIGLGMPRKVDGSFLLPGQDVGDL
jgi:hypothetical protein